MISASKDIKSLIDLKLLLFCLLHWSDCGCLYLYSLFLHDFFVVFDTSFLFFTHWHLLSNHLSSLFLFLNRYECFECISYLCQLVFTHVVNHAFHYFCFLFLFVGPILPEFESWCSCFGIESLQIIAKLLVCLSSKVFLQISQRFTLSVVSIFSLANILVSALYSCGGLILYLLQLICLL